MGIISTIVALIKAVPVLERLFLGVAKSYREQVAKGRYEEKLDFIDTAIDQYHRAGVPNTNAKKGKRKKAGGSSRVSSSRSSGTGVYKGGSKNGGRARAGTGKKVNSLKRKRR